MRPVLPGAILLAALVGFAPQRAAAQQLDSVMTSAGAISVRQMADDLVHPWGMAFLPDGRLLVTERPGRLRIMDGEGNLSDPVEGTPDVFATGQGGLLDVALDPNFSENRLVWLSFAEKGDGDTASTALGRGRFEDGRIMDFKVIFSQKPKVSGPNHFGGRIVFSQDGNVFLTLGERFKNEPAQDLSNHLGTIIRVKQDGSMPQDNPFVGREDGEDAIWSYGHRNIQAAAINPSTGRLWVAEMGPLGGDELNLPEPGRNYGWPVVSWGIHYDGKDIPDPPTRPDFADAIKTWTPVISPSGMIFYSGEMFPQWRGNALIGSLSRRSLVRLETDGSNVTGEEIIPLPNRIRDVAQGPDGALYVITDVQNGKVLRLEKLR